MEKRNIKVIIYEKVPQTISLRDIKHISIFIKKLLGFLQQPISSLLMPHTPHEQSVETYPQVEFLMFYIQDHLILLNP